MTKPIYLVDLDDNLFQTERKLLTTDEKKFSIAALDRKFKPRSYFTQKQFNYLHWLLDHAEVIPVTARGVEETSRVNVGFRSWKVMTHGAVIQDPSGKFDIEWQDFITRSLSSYQQTLHQMQKLLTKAFEEHNVNAWARINYEYDDVAIYLVTKHTNSNLVQEMYDIADKINASNEVSGFYLHRNGNNIAWIPHCVEKGSAVKYLLKKLKTVQLGTPIIGFGDSISDYSFLKHCDWFGMPQNGQITTVLKDELMRLEQIHE